MANKKQLSVLRMGVRAWNTWREKHPKIVPDLSGAELSDLALPGANLREANISDADLTAADLRQAKLSRAKLRRTSLIEADLAEADLSGSDIVSAFLVGARLNGAILHSANLRAAFLNESELRKASLIEADLSGADLSGSDLRGANLAGASLRSTILTDVDLSEVRGLDEVRHSGPSTVGIDTIYKSKGKIPEGFLRGCGVPESMITFMHSLVGTAIEFYSCFISYSSKDEDFAKRLHADLQDKGVRVWFAPEDLKIGDKFRSRIDEAIRMYDKLMLVLSENSINSPWVRKEVRTAFEKEEREKRTVLFPVRLDDSFLDTTEDWADDIRRNRHVGDFKQWKDHGSYQTAFERLLRDLKAGDAK